MKLLARRLLGVVSAILVLNFGGASAALAQSGPTYEDTLEYLQNKLAFSTNSSSYDLLELERCSLAYRNEQNHSDGSQVVNILAFDLQSLDPTEVSFNGMLMVILNTREEERQIIIQRSLTGAIATRSSCDLGVKRVLPSGIDECISDLDTFQMWVQAKNENDAPRIKSAFEHIIQLCGGKGELF